MTDEKPSLQIDVEEQERWRKRLRVTVPASHVESRRQEAMRRLAKRLKLPGFRKGHVPSSVVESRFGDAVRQETLDKVVGDAYREALAIEDLQPISEGELDDLFYEPQEDLVFSISFDVQPEILLARLGGFAVERPAPKVDETQVDEMLERLRAQNGSWETVEGGHPEEDDLVSVRIRKLQDGEPAGEPRPYDLVLGHGDAIPDVEKAIRSLDVGTSGHFVVTFPDDFPDESRRGEEEEIEIDLVERKVMRLPELDDDFAKRVGDFTSVEELRARVREDLLSEAEEQAEAAVRGRLLDFIVEANPFEVPDSMVDRYADSVLGDQSTAAPEKVEELRAMLRPQAESAVKRILVIERIAETQGLRATDDELDARIEEIAEQNNTTAAKVYADLQKAGRLEAIERDLTERKVFEFLKSQSEIIDVPSDA